MNISKTSWHFRLLSFFDLEPAYHHWNANLCVYMRRLTLLLFALSDVVFALIFYPYGWWMVVHGYKIIHWWQGFGLLNWVILSILLGGALVGSFCFCIEHSVIWLYKQLPHKPSTYPEPGIFETYYQSLKDKVCLSITFTE